MMKKILDYKIYLFGRVKEDYEWASMEEGQKIIIAMLSDNPPKFIKLCKTLINTSAISSVSENTEDPTVKTEYRELTESEEKTLSIFNNANNKLLN